MTFSVTRLYKVDCSPAFISWLHDRLTAAARALPPYKDPMYGTEREYAVNIQGSIHHRDGVSESFSGLPRLLQAIQDSGVGRTEVAFSIAVPSEYAPRKVSLRAVKAHQHGRAELRCTVDWTDRPSFDAWVAALDAELSPLQGPRDSAPAAAPGPSAMPASSQSVEQAIGGAIFNIYGTMNVGRLTMAQRADETVTVTEQARLESFVGELYKVLNDDPKSLVAGDDEEAETRLLADTINTQLKSSRPSRKVIKECLDIIAGMIDVLAGAPGAAHVVRQSFKAVYQFFT